MLSALLFRNRDEVILFQIYHVWHMKVWTDCKLALISNDLFA